MGHGKIGRKFGRESHQRIALLRSLCSSLVRYEKIQTTLHKAKDLRRVIEKAVTLAKSEKAEKKDELRNYFHAAQDREIIGRDNIKKYLSNLPKDLREQTEKYLKDPQKNPKPSFVLEYLATDRSEKKQAPRILRVEGILTKLVKRIAPRFEKVEGGYTRIYKLGPRRGDAAEMAVIEFTKLEDVS